MMGMRDQRHQQDACTLSVFRIRISVTFTMPIPCLYAYGLQVFCMNGKNIAVAGLVGGTLLFVLLFGLNVIMNQIIPCNIARFPGIRSVDDPIMLLFFAYPFVVAFAAGYLFDLLCPVLSGSVMQKGVSFGIILLVIVAIPSNFAMYTSMDWPVSFYVGNLIWAVTGFLSSGILFARIWNT